MNNCPHCGKPLNIDSKSSNDIDMESAAVELVLAQMAKIYRQASGRAYATSGDEDIEAIRMNLFVWNDIESPADNMTVSRILKLWKQYLAENGERASIELFFYSWLPASKQEAQVIPFRPR